MTLVPPPPDLKYGYVAGLFLLSQGGDTTADADDLPDIVPATGTITITPAVNRTTSSSPPAMVLKEPHVASITDGWLRDKTGALGLWLIEGSYLVQYKLSSIAVPNTIITVIHGTHTKAAPLYLPLYQPLEEDPQIKFVVNEQVYAEALQARDEAMDAALRAEIAADNATLSAAISDTTTSPTTIWSSSKTAAEITARMNSVIGGAPAALDTLDELAAAINDNASYAASITTLLGNRLRIDTNAQGLSTQQQLNGRTNLQAASAAQGALADSSIQPATLAAALVPKADTTAVTAAIAAMKAEILNAPPGTLDTLDELAAALGDDPNFATTIMTALGTRIRYDAAQSLTEAQKQTVRTTIGAGTGTSNIVLGTTSGTAYDAASAITGLASKAPIVHSHVINDVSGLQTALNAKATLVHTHPVGELSDASPLARTFMQAATGSVMRSTIGAGTGNSNVAIGTTAGTAADAAAVAASLVSLKAEILDSPPGALDTLNELAAALGDDVNFASTMTGALANRVRVDTAAQGLTTQQMLNARTNIGAGVSNLVLGTTSGTAYDAAVAIAALSGKSNTGHTHPLSQISDASTFARALLILTTAAAMRSSLGAIGSSNNSVVDIQVLSSEDDIPSTPAAKTLYATPVV